MKKLVKAIVLSIAALGVGYMAISLPFHLFTTLSDGLMEVVFMAELIIYAIVGALFLIVSERKKKEKIKTAERHTARREKIARVQREWYDLAA